MNKETPLPEVIKFIPSECAELLMYMPEPIQEWVARELRDIMSAWEETDVHLDPITLESVVKPVITTLMSVGRIMIDIANRTET